MTALNDTESTTSFDESEEICQLIIFTPFDSFLCILIICLFLLIGFFVKIGLLRDTALPATCSTSTLESLQSSGDHVTHGCETSLEHQRPASSGDADNLEQTEVKHTVTRGVPQGTALAPMLFQFFIGDDADTSRVTRGVPQGTALAPKMFQSFIGDDADTFPDPCRRYLKMATLLSTDAAILSGRALLTMLGTDVYAVTASFRPAHFDCNPYEIEVWSTTSCQDSVKFELTRRITVNLCHNVLCWMTGCDYTRRLLLVQAHCFCKRIKVSPMEPSTGEVLTTWLLTERDEIPFGWKAVNGNLYVCYKDCLEIYDANIGKILSDIRLNLNGIGIVLPTSDGDGYYVINWTSIKIIRMTSNRKVITRYKWDKNQEEFGAAVDKDGHVVVLGRSAGKQQTIWIFRPGQLDEPLTVMRMTDPDCTSTSNYCEAELPGGVTIREEYTKSPPYLWLDYERGLLFVWSPFRQLVVYRMLDVVV